jgi:hypothetical protein
MEKQLPSSEPDWEEINEQAGGEKLIPFKTSNSMNNMLPSVKDAYDEAEKIKEEISQKRQKVESYKKF